MKIIFFKSVEFPDYFLLCKGANGLNAEKMLRKLTNTGEFENSGYEKADIELAHVLNTEIKGDFFEFLVESIATNHILNPKYDGELFRAWYKFAKYEPEKWMEQFALMQNSKSNIYRNSQLSGAQTTLF